MTSAFFVSLAFMPLSMALAGRAAECLGLTALFAAVVIAPTILAAAAILAVRMSADELAHPLPSISIPA